MTLTLSDQFDRINLKIRNTAIRRILNKVMNEQCHNLKTVLFYNHAIYGPVKIKQVGYDRYYVNRDAFPNGGVFVVITLEPIKEMSSNRAVKIFEKGIDTELMCRIADALIK